MAILFCCNDFCCILFYQLYLNLKSKRQKNIILIIAIVAAIFNVYEGIYYHIQTAKQITKTSNLFKKEFLSEDFNNAINSIDKEDYQSIISLPFYYYGSESYARPRKSEMVRTSSIFSYHTGLPMFAASLTRTSIWESKNIVQLVSPNFYKKEIVNDLKSEKPFLVLRTKNKITEYEKDIFKYCKAIYESEEISIYSLEKEDLFKIRSKDVLDKFFSEKDKLFENSGFLVSKDSTFLYYDSFENMQSEYIFRGKGGFKSVKKGKNTLAEFASNTFEKGKEYKVSIWMYNGLKDALNMWFRFIIEEYNKETDTWTSTVYLPEQSEVINGNWSLVEGSFKVKNPKSKIYIVTKGTDEEYQAFFADDLLVTEKGVDVYSLSDSALFFNNHNVFK